MIFLTMLLCGIAALLLNMLFNFGANPYTIYFLGSIYGAIIYIDDKLDKINKDNKR